MIFNKKTAQLLHLHWFSVLRKGSNSFYLELPCPQSETILLLQKPIYCQRFIGWHLIKILNVLKKWTMDGFYSFAFWVVSPLSLSFSHTHIMISSMQLFFDYKMTSFLVKKFIDLSWLGINFIDLFESTTCLSPSFPTLIYKKSIVEFWLRVFVQFSQSTLSKL